MCIKYAHSKVLEENIMVFLEDSNILGESQGAFRRDRRIEDHLFTLNGICTLRKSSRLITYIAFLDLSEEFDQVWREGLFYLVWKNVVQEKVWRLLKELHSTVSNKVVLGDLGSEI